MDILYSISEFIKKQLDKSKFSGRILTLLLSAFLLVILTLTGIIGVIVNSNFIFSFDTRFADFLLPIRNPTMVNIFSEITFFGEWQAVLAFIFCAVLILWFLKKRIYIIPLLLSVAGSEAFVYFMKILLHRPRPDFSVYTEDSFSFPSGHAAIAVAFYGFLFFIFLRFLKSRKNKIILFFAGIFLILAIGFSRLYLGVHYFSDVLGGYIVGALWLAIAVNVFRHFTYSAKCDINL